jgi:ABC-2 type transport system permease protein
VNRVLAITLRDLRANFLAPGGYIVIALFLLVTGWVFWSGNFQPGQVASLRYVFGIGTWLLSFIAPAITMRAIADEYRTGSIETLLTSPLHPWQIIVGKYLSALLFLIIMLLPTVVYVLAVEMHGRPDYGELLCGYLGLVLAGAAYLASGILASTLTSSQAVAFLVAVFFWLVLGIAARQLPAEVPSQYASVIASFDPALHLRDFTIGLVDTANVVFFGALTVVFLVIAVAVLDLRRIW